MCDLVGTRHTLANQTYPHVLRKFSTAKAKPKANTKANAKAKANATAQARIRMQRGMCVRVLGANILA